MKGGIREHYPELWMRTSSDINISVHEKNSETAISDTAEGVCDIRTFIYLMLLDRNYDVDIYCFWMDQQLWSLTTSSGFTGII